MMKKNKTKDRNKVLKELIERIQKDDNDLVSKNRLYNMMHNYAVFIFNKHKYNETLITPVYSSEDFIQHSILHVFKYLRRYDNQCAPSTWIGNYLKWGMLELNQEDLKKKMHLKYCQRYYVKVSNIIDSFFAENGYKPTIKEIYERMNEPTITLEWLGENINNITNFFTESDCSEGEDFSLFDHIDPQQTRSKELSNDTINEWINNDLSERERTIIIGRFYYGLILKEVAPIFNVTKEYIRLLQEEALEKLKDRCGIENRCYYYVCPVCNSVMRYLNNTDVAFPSKCCEYEFYHKESKTKNNTTSFVNECLEGYERAVFLYKTAYKKNNQEIASMLKIDDSSVIKYYFISVEKLKYYFTESCSLQRRKCEICNKIFFTKSSTLSLCPYCHKHFYKRKDDVVYLRSLDNLDMMIDKYVESSFCFIVKRYLIHLDPPNLIQKLLQINSRTLRRILNKNINLLKEKSKCSFCMV